MYITRRERFSASHQLINHQLNNQDNKNLFGKCYNLHGHNYELFVTITGKINPKSGFIIDLKNLKKIICKKVINKIDHQNLNEVEFLNNTIPTTENLCIAIWGQIEYDIKKLGGKLYKIKIKETENNYFEYYGE